MIQKILIVHQETSLPVFEKNIIDSSSYESSIITSILQAISAIGQEILGCPTTFKKLQYHGFVISSSHFNGFTIYVFSETELVKELEKGMSQIVKWFSCIFSSKNEIWDGRMDVFTINKDRIESKVVQFLFLWLLYPFQINRNHKIKNGNLTELGRILMDCIRKEEKCTLARILNEYSHYDEETILYEIFNFVNNRYIIVSNND
jgi:hypothetical protein